MVNPTHYAPKSREQLAAEARSEEQRTIDAKIDRLRQRVKQAPHIDGSTRGILLGILDLLGDEL